MRKVPIFLLLGVAACSTSPTQYIPKTSNHGYTDSTMGQNLRMAEFIGNSKTKKEVAELYAKLRAIEICHDMKRMTHIMTVKDKTYTKDITQANTTGPSYYYGMSPYYGRYGGYGPGMSMGYNNYTTSYSTETYTYPHFEVYFECGERAWDAGVHLKPLSASQMESLVKDLQGAVLVEDVVDYSPNKGVIQKGDIITKVSNERVTKVLDVYEASRKNPGAPLKINLFRDGKEKEVTANFKDVSDLTAEAEKEIIKAGCKMDDVVEKSKLCKK